MKIQLFHIIIPLAIICNSCTNESQELKTVIIAGEVIGFDKTSDQDFVEFLIIEPFTTHTSNTIFLDEIGSFKIILERIYPQEILIRYKQLFAVYTFPGDSIHVSIDAILLSSELNKHGDIYDYIQVTGDSEKFNQDYQNFQRMYSDSLFNFFAERESIAQLNHVQYRNYIDNRTSHYDLLMEDFNNNFNTCRQFREWIKIWGKTNALNDLMSYRYLHPFYNVVNVKEKDSLRVPKGYFSFLNEKESFNEDFMISIEYFRFLWEYYLYFYNEVIPQNLQNQQYELAKIKDHITANNITKLYILRNTSGFLQKVLITTFYHQLLDWRNLRVHEHLYEPQLIGRDDYCQTIETKYNSIMENANNPILLVDKHIDSYTENKSSRILTSILEKFPNKVIFIVFWTPWCEPCMEQMPFLKETQKEYKNKDVVFVFLACRCSEYSWKATISEKWLSGYHYVLSDEQYAFLSERFQISDIPHYLLIDKKGVVVNENAPQASAEENLGKLLNVLL